MKLPVKHSATGLSAGLVIAGLLAGTAVWATLSARAAERRYPPSGRFIDVDDVRLHYLDMGSGPPVVLLHGNGASLRDFIGCGLADALASRHRVIAFDRPGFGYSTRPRDGMWPAERQAALLARACRELGVERPVVVGHSWATLVALAMALEPSFAVRGLVLVSGYYYSTMRPDGVLLGMPRVPVVGDAMRYTVSALLSRAMLPAILRQMFYPRPVAPEFLDAVHRGMILRPWQLRSTAEASWLMTRNAKQLSERYRELTVPVEIFAGAADRIAAQEGQSVRLHDELPNSNLHLLPGEGHMLHYGASPTIARAVDRLSADDGFRVVGAAEPVERRDAQSAAAVR